MQDPRGFREGWYWIVFGTLPAIASCNGSGLLSRPEELCVVDAAPGSVQTASSAKPWRASADDEPQRFAGETLPDCRRAPAGTAPARKPVLPVSRQALSITSVDHAFIDNNAPITLRISGSSFANGDSVWVGGVQALTRFVSSSTLEAWLPPRPELFGLTSLAVRRENGLSDVRNDLLRYVTSRLSWNRLAISSGYSPTSVVAKDFNHDNKLDLTASNLLDSEIWVVFGDGAGDFYDLVSTWPAPGDSARSYSAASEDWDGDGHADLVLAQGMSREVRVMWGDGRGEFPASLRISTGIAAVSVLSVDADNDGRRDLVIVGRQPDQLVLLRNSGNRTFAKAQTWPLGQNPIGLAGGDFNRDNWPDIITTNELSSTLNVLINKREAPDASFEIKTPISTCSDPHSVSLGEMNADGYLDAVVTCPKSGAVCVHFGAADGSFGGPTCEVLLREPMAVALDDLNGDGFIDMAVANYKGNASIFRNRGNGSFFPEEQVVTGKNSTGIIAADFNEDGRPDLAVSNLGSGYTTVHINQISR